MANPTRTSAGAPDWDALFEVAQGQAGYFTTRQGAAAGYSPQLLAYLGAKTVVRIRLGIYRLVFDRFLARLSQVAGREEQGHRRPRHRIVNHQRLPRRGTSIWLQVDRS